MGISPRGTIPIASWNMRILGLLTNKPGFIKTRDVTSGFATIWQWRWQPDITPSYGRTLYRIAYVDYQ